MAQWVNRNIFLNPLPLPLSCEISGALHLAQLGLTAGWLAGRQAGWQAGRQAGWLMKYRRISKFSKLAIG